MKQQAKILQKEAAEKAKEMEIMAREQAALLGDQA